MSRLRDFGMDTRHVGSDGSLRVESANRAPSMAIQPR